MPMFRSMVVCSIAVMWGLLPSGIAASPVHGLEAGLQSDLEATARSEGITLDEAVARWELSEAAEPLVEAVYDDPDDFAGVYYGPTKDGTWALHVMVSGTPGPVVTLAPKVGTVVWEDVSRSFRDLTVIRDAIVNMWRLDLDRLTSVSIYEPTNQVIVTAPTLDGDLLRTIQTQFGEAVALSVEPHRTAASCTSTSDPNGESRYNCTPWRAGIELQTSPGSHVYACTMGFWAKGKSSGIKYVLTAGHCDPEPFGAAFYHASQYVGTVSLNSFENENSTTDVARLPATANSSTMNAIYRNVLTQTWRITGKKSPSTQVVGLSVCKSGVGLDSFGERCGEITNANDSWFTNGHIFFGKQADFSVTGGDSGATVFYGSKIFGMAVTSDGNYGTASGIETDMAVWLCLSADCSLP